MLFFAPHTPWPVPMAAVRLSCMQQQQQQRSPRASSEDSINHSREWRFFWQKTTAHIYSVSRRSTNANSSKKRGLRCRATLGGQSSTHTRVHIPIFKMAAALSPLFEYFGRHSTDPAWIQKFELAAKRSLLLRWCYRDLYTDNSKFCQKKTGENEKPAILYRGST